MEKTKRVNRREIQKGRCRVIQGDVSRLPFGDEKFDLATAFETVYFWPGPMESLREVYRVLKPGGTFLIANESDGMSPSDEKWLSTIDGLRIFDKAQLSVFLTEVGFTLKKRKPITVGIVIFGFRGLPCNYSAAFF